MQKPLLFICGVLALACAGGTKAPSLSGTLRLVPSEAIASLPAASESYGDRRYRDAVLVDYTRPGFAVVYLDEGRAPSDTIELSIRDSRRGPRITPAQSAVGLRGTIRIVNESENAHVIACPEADWLARLEAREAVSLEPRQAGSHTLVLFGSPERAASLFVAPGPFSIVSSRGHWELFDIEPGTWNVRTWHARFPSTRQAVTVPSEQAAHVELQVSTQKAEPKP